MGEERRVLGLNTVCVWDGLIYSVAFGDHGEGGDINVEQMRLFLKNRMERIVELYSQVRPSLSSQRQAMKAMDVSGSTCFENIVSTESKQRNKPRRTVSGRIPPLRG